MADFNGNGDQEVKININLVGGEEAAKGLEDAASSITDIASATEGATDKAVKNQERITREIEKAAEAKVEEAIAAERAAKAAERQAEIDAARAKAAEERVANERRAAEIAQKAEVDRLDGLERYRKASEEIARIRKEQAEVEGRAQSERSSGGEQLREANLQLGVARQKREEAERTRQELELILALQRSTAIKPYEGPLVDPGKIQEAKKQIAELEAELKKLSEERGFAVQRANSTIYEGSRTRTVSGRTEYKTPSSDEDLQKVIKNREEAEKLLGEITKRLSAKGADPATPAELDSISILSAILKSDTSSPGVSEAIASVKKRADDIRKLTAELEKLREEEIALQGEQAAADEAARKASENITGSLTRFGDRTSYKPTGRKEEDDAAVRLRKLQADRDARMARVRELEKNARLSPEVAALKGMEFRQVRNLQTGESSWLSEFDIENKGLPVNSTYTGATQRRGVRYSKQAKTFKETGEAPLEDQLRAAEADVRGAPTEEKKAKAQANYEALLAKTKKLREAAKAILDARTTAIMEEAKPAKELGDEIDKIISELRAKNPDIARQEKLQRDRARVSDAQRSAQASLSEAKRGSGSVSPETADQIIGIVTRAQEVATAPSDWVPAEVLARRADEATAKFDSGYKPKLNRLNALSREVSDAEGRTGTYQTPITINGRTIRSGAPVRDPRGRTDEQLQIEIEKAKEAEVAARKEVDSQRSAVSSAQEKIRASESEILQARIEATRKINESLSGLVETATETLDDLFNKLLNSVADDLVAEFKAANPTASQEAIDSFREKVLSTGLVSGAKNSATSSGEQRKGAPITSIPGEPGAPIPEEPSVGVARIAAEKIMENILRSFPALGLAAGQAVTNELQSRPSSARVSSGKANDLTGIDIFGRQPSRQENTATILATRDQVDTLLKKLTELEAKRADGVLSQEEEQELKEINASLKLIAESRIDSGTGDEIADRLLRALGRNPSSSFGGAPADIENIADETLRKIFEILPDRFAATTLGSVFGPPGMRRIDEQGGIPALPGTENFVADLLIGTETKARKDKQGNPLGIELSPTRRIGSDLIPFQQMVQDVIDQINALFFTIHTQIESGDVVDPEIVERLKDQILGITGIMRTVKQIEDQRIGLQGNTTSKYGPMLQGIDASRGPLAGMLAFLANGGYKGLGGFNPENGESATAAKVFAEQIAPLLSGLTSFSSGISEVIGIRGRSATPGSGNYEIPGYTDQEGSAVGDINKLRGLAAIFVHGAKEQVIAALAEALARSDISETEILKRFPNLLNSEQKTALNQAGPKSGVFELGTAENRQAFAKIAASNEEFMSVISNPDNLAQMLGLDKAQYGILLMAKEFVEAQQSIENFRSAVDAFVKDVLAVPAIGRGSDRGEYNYSPAPRQQQTFSLYKRISSVDDLGAEGVRTLTTKAIPRELRPGYTGPEYGNKPSDEDAKAEAEAVLEYLKKHGYSVSTRTASQPKRRMPIFDILGIDQYQHTSPEKITITVVHKGESISADKTAAVTAGQVEATFQRGGIVLPKGITLTSTEDAENLRRPGSKNSPPGVTTFSSFERDSSTGLLDEYANVTLARGRKGTPIAQPQGVAGHEIAHATTIDGTIRPGGLSLTSVALVDVLRAIEGGDSEKRQKTINLIGEDQANALIKAFKDATIENSGVHPVTGERISLLDMASAGFGQFMPEIDALIQEFIANTLSQASGNLSGDERGISFAKGGQLPVEAVQALQKLFGEIPVTSFEGKSRYEATAPHRFELNPETGEEEGMGGLTRRLRLMPDGRIVTTEEEPAQGFSVGGAHLESARARGDKLPSAQVRLSELGTSEAFDAATNAFILENEQEIRDRLERGEEVWLGGWSAWFEDQAKGVKEKGFAFDLTDVVADRGDAERLARERGQQSIGEYRGGKYAVSHAIPGVPDNAETGIFTRRMGEGGWERSYEYGQITSRKAKGRADFSALGPTAPKPAEAVDDDSFEEDTSDTYEEDTSDTYTPVEEQPVVKEKKAKAKKAKEKAKDDLLNIVTPAEAEVALAEELGVTAEELATLTDGQVKKLQDAANQAKMAKKEAEDAEAAKTAGSRAKAAEAAGRAALPGIQTPLEAQVAEGEALGMTPDQAAATDPAIIEKKKKEAQDAKIAELNRQDEERRARVLKAQQDRAAAAEAAAKKAEEAAKATATPAEPTKEEYEAQVAADNAARKERVAAQRRARAAARKAAKAEEAVAAATEKSAEASDAVAEAETKAATAKEEVAQTVSESTPAQVAAPPPPAPPNRPPAPPTPPSAPPPNQPPTPPAPPAGGGQQPDDFEKIDALVNAAIERLGLGNKLPALENIVAKIAEEIDRMVNAQMEQGAKAGISYNREDLKSSIVESNIGGFKDILTYLDGIAAQAEKLRSQGAMPIMGEGALAGTPTAVAERVGNASWIPEGLKRADLMAIGADFDRLGQEVALLIEMSKRGAMRIQQEVNDSKAVAKDGGGGGGKGPSGGSSGWGTEGYGVPDLQNIYKGSQHLKELANVYRELRPQVLHLTGNIDQASTVMQKQQRAAENVTQALGAYMNVNTGILRSLKTQVGRAATFLFVQQIGREIATVVEHLQSGVFNFNQVLENTTVGFNTLFANTLQAATSAENELVPAYNAVGAQIGFMKEQALTFNEALALTSDAAENMVAKIRDIANVTPFRFQPLVEASLKMKAFGFEAREIPDMINSISNAVAALGGNDEKIDRIAYALGQMNSAGRVYQNDMMQLANAGIAGYRMLSEKMLTDLVALKKYTMGELKDLPDYVIDEMKRLQGAISSGNFVKSFGNIDEMIATLQDPKRAEGLIRNMAKRGFLLGSVAARAITEGMDKQYQGSADRLSRTMTGALSTIADLSQNFMATAFKPLFDSVRDTIVELGQFMLKSQEITIFVDKVQKNIKGFVDSLRNFGPALQNIGNIFINVFVGGVGAALERGSQFGSVMGSVVEKVSSGLSLIGEILSDKVGRGLAAAATLGTLFVKAIMANPMIATITLIIVAISGVADALKKNIGGSGTAIAVFVDAVKGFIAVIADALATIAKNIAESGITAFITALTVGIIGIMPFLTVLLGTFAAILKILTPIAPILGILLGLFLAFKTATMAWQIVTATLAKPISTLVGAWNSASDAVNKYGASVKMTADRHNDLKQEKIAARDYVYGDNGEVLMDKNGKPMINYDRRTEKISSEGYPSQSQGEMAEAQLRAGGKMKGLLEGFEKRFLPESMRGILSSPREKFFSMMAPDFNGGFTLQHNDQGGGHLSPVFTKEKIQNRFDSFQKGGVLEDLGKELSAAGVLELPGLQKGKLDAQANKYTTAWGKNFETLVLIEREASYVLTEAFQDVETMAKKYKSAMASGSKDEAATIIANFKEGKSGRMLLPMLMRAKGDKRKLSQVSDEEIGALLGGFHDGSIKLSARDMRRIETLPPEVQKILYGEVSKKVARGNSKFTPDEAEQLEKIRARAMAAGGIKGGSIGMIQKMGAAMVTFYDTLNKKTAQLVKNIPLLNKLQTVNLGGAGTGLSQIARGEDGQYYYTTKSGAISKRRVSDEVLESRRSMRGGAFGLLSGMKGRIGQLGAVAGISSAASRASGMNNAFLMGLEMFGMGNILGPDIKQTLSQKAGLFQSLGNGIGAMLGTGFGSMIPIIGPIIGPAIGSMFGELVGNLVDSMIRGSEAAVNAKKAKAASFEGIGISAADAALAASAQSKSDNAMGYVGENGNGLPFLVNGLDELPKGTNLDRLRERLQSKDFLNSFDLDNSGAIDPGVELTRALSYNNENLSFMAGRSFDRDSNGNFIYTGSNDVENRRAALEAGYVDLPQGLGMGDVTNEEAAASDLVARQMALIQAASISVEDFKAMFPDLSASAIELSNFNRAEITNPSNTNEMGDRMNLILKSAGFGVDAQGVSEAFDDSQLADLMQQGTDFKSVIQTLRETVGRGGKISEAAQKLLDYANKLETESVGSFFDDMGQIRTEYKSGFARLLSLDQKQIEATTVMGGEKGDEVVVQGKGFATLFGAREVASGTGIGGGEMAYSDFLMAGLREIGRIDPVEAMQEAGVIQSLDEMVGWTAKQIQDAWSKTMDYFAAFRKRAEALEPKVDLKMSRRQLMEEFGRDLGYELFDEFFAQRKQLSGLESQRKKLGGDAELARLTMLEEATKGKKLTTTQNVYEGGRIVGTEQVQTDLPTIMTAEEIGKLARMRELDKSINDLRYQRFKISVLQDKRTSSDEKTRNQALKDAALLNRFEADHAAELAKIQEKVTKGISLTRAEIALSQEQKNLRDKIYAVVKQEVSLGETLALLEKQGISISNKELLNNQVLLQVIAEKARLQEAANKQGKNAVYWAQLEAQAKSASATLAERQVELERAKYDVLTKYNLSSFAGASNMLGRDISWENPIATKAYAEYTNQNAKLIAEIASYQRVVDNITNQLKSNPFGFTTEELDRIKALVAQAQGSIVGGDQGASTSAAIQRNTSLLNTMASVAQKAYDRIRKAQQKTHDEYIKQLDDQAKAIDERYKKRTQEQTEKGLLEQLQLAGLQMRSESADPLEAAKSFYEAKNNLAEFYIEKQKEDELKAISDEKERYQKQFEENAGAQEEIYNAALTRMQNRFEAVSKIIGMENIDGETLSDLLRLTMTGTLPGMSDAMKNLSQTDIFKNILAAAENVATMGQQQLALGEQMGTLEFGQFAAESGTYSIPASLKNGLSQYNKLTGANGYNVFRGTTQESGLLATFMNEKIGAGLTYTDVGNKSVTGASAIRDYLKGIMPSGGFGSAEKDKEKAAVFEYVEALLSGKNTFGTTAKLALLAQRTLEQGLTDFEKATKTNINMASLLEADLSDEVINKFIQASGETPTAEAVQKLRDMVRDTYADVLAKFDLEEYAKFADSTDSRIGNLSGTLNSLDDVMSHLAGTLGAAQKDLTTLDKILFGTVYDETAPISGIDAATEQLQSVTDAIEATRAAFESTMTNLEAYAGSLQGPIGAFHQLALEMGNISALATDINTTGIAGAKATVTTYNQVPVNITISNAQNMDPVQLAQLVEEGVGRALRGSGGSYITSPVSVSTT